MKQIIMILQIFGEILKMIIQIRMIIQNQMIMIFQIFPKIERLKMIIIMMIVKKNFF